MQYAKVLISEDHPSEEELDSQFRQLFQVACDSGFPIHGFLLDDVGQWMFGPSPVFKQAFSQEKAVILFDLEHFLKEKIAENNGHYTFWMAQLNNDPRKSKLMKMVK